MAHRDLPAVCIPQHYASQGLIQCYERYRGLVTRATTVVQAERSAEHNLAMEINQVAVHPQSPSSPSRTKGQLRHINLRRTRPESRPKLDHTMNAPEQNGEPLTAPSVYTPGDSSTNALSFADNSNEACSGDLDV